MKNPHMVMFSAFRRPRLKRHGLDIKVIKIPQPLSSIVIIRLGLKMKSVIKIDDSSNQMHQDYQYSNTKGWT